MTNNTPIKAHEIQEPTPSITPQEDSKAAEPPKPMQVPNEPISVEPIVSNEEPPANTPPENIAVDFEAKRREAIAKIRQSAERITRRNMKIQVSEHIQEYCEVYPEFTVLVMNPKKSLINCFRYINRKAMEWIKEDAKARGEGLRGECGGDVPDDIVFDWAIEYFRLTDLQEDKPKPAPKAVPAKAPDKKADKKGKGADKGNEKKKGDAVQAGTDPIDANKKLDIHKKEACIQGNAQLTLFG